MFRGNFGVSYNISKNTPISCRIGFQAVFLGALIGLVLGIIAAIKHRTIWDTVATVISIGVSVPSYVFALALSYQFGFRWKLFPMLFTTQSTYYSSVLPSVSL